MHSLYTYRQEYVGENSIFYIIYEWTHTKRRKHKKGYSAK